MMTVDKVNERECALCRMTKGLKPLAPPWFSGTPLAYICATCESRASEFTYFARGSAGVELCGVKFRDGTEAVVSVLYPWPAESLSVGRERSPRRVLSGETARPGVFGASQVVSATGIFELTKPPIVRGIPQAPAGDPERPRHAGRGRPTRGIDADHLRELRAAGMSEQAIAARLGVSQPTIHRRLSRLKGKAA